MVGLFMSILISQFDDLFLMHKVPWDTEDYHSSEIFPSNIHFIHFIEISLVFYNLYFKSEEKNAES